MLIILIFLIQAIFCYIIKDFIDLETLSLILILMNSILFTFFLAEKIKEKEIYKIIFFGYILRLLILLIDIYGREYIVLPHSGDDTERFYLYGILISENLQLLNTTYLTGYADLLGVFFYLFGDQRMLAQYLNTLLGIGVIIVTYKILKLLSINQKIRIIVICIITFFPQTIIFSGILLRENLVAFGLVMMIYYSVLWYKQGGMKNIVLSILFLLIAAYFHSGVIVAFIPLVFMYTFYKHKLSKFGVDVKALFLLGVFLIIGLVVSLNIGEVLFSKFGDVDITNKEFYSSMNTTEEGGSNYLEGLRYDNLYEILLFSPLKMFYFLFSPIPLDWRGAMDLITFFIDSLVYFLASIYLIKNRKIFIKDKPLLIVFSFILLFIIFTFAYGTHAAGTAIRHRSKIVAVLLICWALLIDQKNKQFQRRKGAT